MEKFQFILLSSALVVVAYVLLLMFKLRNAARGKGRPETPAQPGDADESDLAARQNTGAHDE